MTNAVLVLTTFTVDADTSDLARTLISERLAACVSVTTPLKSTYRWKQAVEEADERQVVIKTTNARVGELEARLRELHPYEVPEFVVLEISGGSEAYLKWLQESA